MLRPNSTFCALRYRYTYVYPGEHYLQQSMIPSSGWLFGSYPVQFVYTCQDAIPYFALQSDLSGANITLDGYGRFRRNGPLPREYHIMAATRSQNAIIPHVQGSCDNKSPQGLTIKNARQASIRGLTFIDFPNHHIIADASNAPCGPRAPLSIMAGIKVMGWRANGDGIHVCELSKTYLLSRQSCL